MGWWSSIWRSRAESWLFERLDEDRVVQPIAHRDVVTDADYLTIELRALRIVDVRKGLSKFYAAAHSYASLAHLSGQPAEFHVVSVPANLRNIDAANVERVVQERKPVLGPVPYRGGAVELELGLFSVKSADLVEPYLTLLERISGLAGVAVVNTALPFAQPLVDGVRLLTGGSDETMLEVGVATAFTPPQTGYYVVIRAPRHEWRGRLRVGEGSSLVNEAGDEVTQFPYLVFSVSADDKRDDWFQLPDIADAYRTLRSDVRRGNFELARESFAFFKRVALTSPDLLTDHSDMLVTKVEAEMQDALGATLTAGAEQTEMRELRDLNLFES
jgi:hypothetical protein